MTFEYFIPILFDTAFFVQAIDFYFKMLSATAFNLGMNPEAIIFLLACTANMSRKFQVNFNNETWKN